MRRGALVLAAALAGAACVEKLGAPGLCPDYCPDRLTVVDTVLRTSLDRDTAFRGYVRPHEAGVLLIVDRPGVKSWGIARTFPLPVFRFGTDTTPAPIAHVDSVRLQLIITQPDTAPLRNLRLHIYRVPKNIDSTTTYAQVAPSFGDSLVRTVTLDSLLALPLRRDSVLNSDVRRDSVTGDYLRVDTIQKRLIINLKLDSAQAPYVPADSGRLAFGVAVTADSLAQAVLGRARSGTGLSVGWYLRLDSLQRDTVARFQSQSTEFDTFVFDPPLPPLDSTLAVGGVPAARSILRVTLPRVIRDSAQVVRATLVLVPDRAAQGVPADSFLVAARRVLSDLGAKSPLAGPLNPNNPRDSTHVGLSWIRIGSTDTVRVEVTQILQLWTADTTRPSAFMLQQWTNPRAFMEGATFAEVRFRPSSDAAYRPALHITYAPRFRFEVP